MRDNSNWEDMYVKDKEEKGWRESERECVIYKKKKEEYKKEKEETIQRKRVRVSSIQNEKN